MAKKFNYSIMYRSPGEIFFRQTFIKARSRRMALRKLLKQLKSDFEYDICKDYD